jgi:hypothetical protein
VSGDLAEMLAGASLAARFAADPTIWETFTGWLSGKGYLHEGEILSRENMLLSSMTLSTIIREIEVQLLAEGISVSLGKQ